MLTPDPLSYLFLYRNLSAVLPRVRPTTTLRCDARPAPLAGTPVLTVLLSAPFVTETPTKSILVSLRVTLVMLASISCQLLLSLLTLITTKRVTAKNAMPGRSTQEANVSTAPLERIGRTEAPCAPTAGRERLVRPAPQHAQFVWLESEVRLDEERKQRA